MFNKKTILDGIEFSPLLFSVVHRYGGGADTNRRGFVNLIRSGAVVIEVGANQGSYTALFSRLVGGTGKVHAFEPVNESFERLSERLRSINTKNVTAWQMGVADCEIDEREIIIPGKDSQQASLVAHRGGSWAHAKETRREVVSITSLDAYLKKHGVSHVDFVKLDVEGAELFVLQGGRQCFAQFKPLLHLEIESEWLRDFGTTAGDLIQLLQSYGYDFAYRIDAASLKGFRRMDDSEYSTLRSKPVSGDFLFSVASL